MVLLYIYIVLMVWGIGCIVWRKSMTLISIFSLFKFTGIIFILQLVYVFLWSSLIAWYILGLFISLAVIFYLMKDQMFICKYSDIEASNIIEEAFGQTLMKFKRVSTGYILQISDGREFPLLIQAISSKYVIIQISRVKEVKKLEVLRNLLLKKFARVFPRIVIKLKPYAKSH